MRIHYRLKLYDNFSWKKKREAREEESRQGNINYWNTILPLMWQIPINWVGIVITISKKSHKNPNKSGDILLRNIRGGKSWEIWYGIEGS